MRQMASHLAMPVFMVDPKGTLIFYNEPAEALLGRRFEEAGEMPVEEWSTVFLPTDEHGAALAPDRLPLVVALEQRRPAHADFFIEGLDGTRHRLSVTAFPLIGHDARELGAVAMFWEDQGAWR
jgi:PAS domain-containing protein